METCTLFSKKKNIGLREEPWSCFNSNVIETYTEMCKHGSQTVNNMQCETVDPLRSKEANWLYFCVTLVPHFCATGQRKSRVTFSISSASFKETIQRIRSARMAVLCNTRKKELRRQRTSRDFQKIHDKYLA